MNFGGHLTDTIFLLDHPMSRKTHDGLEKPGSILMSFGGHIPLIFCKLPNKTGNYCFETKVLVLGK